MILWPKANGTDVFFFTLFFSKWVPLVDVSSRNHCSGACSVKFIFAHSRLLSHDTHPLEARPRNAAQQVQHHAVGTIELSVPMKHCTSEPQYNLQWLPETCCQD